MFSTVTAMGYAVDAPEIVEVKDGRLVANLVIGITVTKGESVFLPVSAWGNLANVLDRFVEKGTLVGFTGYLRQRRLKAGSGEWIHQTSLTAERVHLAPKKAQTGPPEDQPDPEVPTLEGETEE